MSRIIVECEQGSEEWMNTRIGVPGASCLDQIVNMKGERSTQRTKLLYKLAGERLLNRKEETYSNAAMQRGVELEPVARAVFEMETGLDVRQVGYVYYDERMDRGCSPDGLIGEESGLEIKCPSLPVHIEYLLGGKLPSAYYQQVQGSMYYTGRSEWWFMSFYPELKPLIVKVKANDAFILPLSAEMDLFCQELSELTDKLRAMQ